VVDRPAAAGAFCDLYWWVARLLVALMLNILGVEDRLDETLPIIRPLVLAVDDEPGVLAFVASVLRQLGVTALTAGSGIAAVQLLSQYQAGKVGLVLLDVNMPGMDGPTTLPALRRIDPGLKCCFMSGGSVPYTAEALLAMTVVGILLKPFKPDALANIVKKVVPTVAG
jgi:CheY-like chemotaxis protein